MGHIHKYSMHCCRKTKQWFYLLLLLSSNYQVCCWTIIVHRLVSKTVFKNMCAAGMAMGLNMSLASLCSHINKSTYNVGCKPQNTSPPRNPPLPISDSSFSFSPAGGAPDSTSMCHDVYCFPVNGSKCMMSVLHCFYCKINDLFFSTM